MDKRTKTRWLKALRSGKYKQTRGQLRDDETDDVGETLSSSFCCLGVLCEIMKKPYDASDGIPDGSILEELELESNDADALACLNDGTDQSQAVGKRLIKPLAKKRGRTFKQIATIIEKYLP